MMSRVKKGMVAGFVATLAVSLLEMANMLGHWFLPFPGVIANMLGMSGNMVVGWIAHLFIGTVVLGGLFGYLIPKLPTDTSGTKGILFAVGAFVVLMVGIFLFGDPAMFGGSDGFATVAWLLITNAVFGVAMGTVYGQLVTREKRLAREMGGVPAH